jgi:CheY-like chemotaxis protein
MFSPIAPLSVLVVDDLPDAADSLSVLLALHGCAVRTAPDGPAALSAAACDMPDVVVTDLAMPRLTGWDLCRALKEQVGGGRPYVVAVTGLAGEDDRRRSEEAGIDVHLVKPVEPDALFGVLRGLRSGSASALVRSAAAPALSH